MWAYNVTRALLSHSGLDVVPHEVPKDEEVALRFAFRSPLAPGQICCIKVHRSLSPEVSDLNVVFTYRDVRDSLFSYMRFTSCDFDAALPTVHKMMSMTDHYFENFPERVVRIRYDRIIEEPRDVADKIARFLNVDADGGTIAEICERFSKESVSNLVASLDSVAVVGAGTIVDREQRRRYEPVKNLDGRTYRVLDRATGFQSGHVSTDGVTWRTGLSEAQKRKLTGICHDWLERYDFPE